MTQNKVDDASDAPDGRLFGVRRPEDAGKVSFEALPDDISDMEKQILMVALVNRQIPSAWIQGMVQKEYYPDNPEDAPASSTVYNCLKRHGFSKGRKDGRQPDVKEEYADAIEHTKLTRKAREEAKKESSSNDTLDEPDNTPDSGSNTAIEGGKVVKTRRGNATYTGPSKGLDMTMQSITERPNVDAEEEPEPQPVPARRSIGMNGHTETRFIPSDGDEQNVKQVELYDDELIPAIKALVRGNAPDGVIRAVAKKID